MKLATLTYAKAVLKAVVTYKVELLFSFVFASIFMLGYLLSAYQSIDITPITGSLIFAYFCGFFVLWAIFLSVLNVLKRLCLNKTKILNVKIYSNLTNKRLWLITTLLIYIFYIPIIIACYSVLSPDSWNSIRQLTGQLPLNNAHPIIFTLFAGVFVKFGLLFGSLELGLILFSIVQSLLMAMIFAWIIVWMRNEGAGRATIATTFIFYTFLPVNAIAGIIMWKDVLFAGFGLLLLILIRNLYLRYDTFFTRKNILCFIVLAFLFCTWRNNGFYAYVIFSLLAIALNYKLLLNKKSVALLFLPIFLFLIYSAIVSLFTTSSSKIATVSVPAQQIARTVKYHGNSLSNRDKNEIDEIFDYDKIGKVYNPELADPVLYTFKEKTFSNNKEKYIALWFRLFMDHQKTFIATFLYKSYGYTYPYYPSSTATDVLQDNDIHVFAIEGYRDTSYDSGNKQAVSGYRDFIWSIIPLFRNIGFYTCIMLLAIYVAIIRKKRELVGVFILLFCLFLSTAVGPVNGEFRYLYLFVISMPFILTSVFTNDVAKKVRRKHG